MNGCTTFLFFTADGKYVITACYDNTVSIWDIETGAKKLTIPGHCGPARAVAWINPTSFSSESSSSQSQVGTFASTSHDQTVMLYRYISTSTICIIEFLEGSSYFHELGPFRSIPKPFATF